MWAIQGKPLNWCDSKEGKKKTKDDDECMSTFLGEFKRTKLCRMARRTLVSDSSSWKWRCKHRSEDGCRAISSQMLVIRCASILPCKISSIKNVSGEHLEDRFHLQAAIPLPDEAFSHLSYHLLYSFRWRCHHRGSCLQDGSSAGCGGRGRREEEGEKPTLRPSTVLCHIHKAGGSKGVGNQNNIIKWSQSHLSTQACVGKIQRC